MNYTRRIDTDKAVEMQISSFTGKGGTTEYQVMVSITDPCLSFVEQLQNLLRVYVTVVKEELSNDATAVFRRYFLSDWSIEEFAATLYRELPALRIKVNGRLHAGYVIVVLNGSDYYEVYLVKGMDVECVNSEVCFDELGGVIDRAIESGTDKAEYDKFCEQERQNLYVTVVTV